MTATGAQPVTARASRAPSGRRRQAVLTGLTVTVFATVGFGDIAPVTQTARIVVTLQMLTDLLLIGVIVKVLIGAAQHRRAALEDEANGAGSAAAVPDVTDRARPDPP